MVVKIQSGDIDFSLGKLYLSKYFDLHPKLQSKAVDSQRPKREGLKSYEVFRVRVDMLEGTEGYLFGKIYCSNLYKYVCIYNWEGTQGQPINGGGCDLLTMGSGAAIDFEDYGYVIVDLLLSTSENQDFTDCTINHPPEAMHNPLLSLGSWFDNDEECEDPEDLGANVARISNCKGCFTKKGNFVGGNFARNEGLYFPPTRHGEEDKVGRYTVSSVDGSCSVTILYAYFPKAIRANVEVIWLRPEEPEFGVYGLIAARNSEINEDGYEIILFRKEVTQSVAVKFEQPIQLCRSMVAVPIDSDLLVRVHLGTNVECFPRAILRFPSQQFGTTTELVINDIMKVKVTWEEIRV